MFSFATPNINRSIGGLPSSGKFRPASWDPLLICGQIVVIQALFNITFCLIYAFLAIIFSLPLTLRPLYSYSTVSLSDKAGGATLISFLATGFLSGFHLRTVVARGKLCLDFAFTTHLLHLLGSCIYSGGLPFSFFWWLTMGCSMLLMAWWGEHLCVEQDLLPISLTNYANLTQDNTGLDVGAVRSLVSTGRIKRKFTTLLAFVPSLGTARTANAHSSELSVPAPGSFIPLRNITNV